MSRLVNRLGLNVGLSLYQGARWLLMAVIPALLVGAAGYMYGRDQPKTYQATATMYVQQSSPTGAGLVGSSDPFASSQLASSYSQMIVDPTIAAAASKTLAAKYPGYSAGGVSSSQQAGTANSQLFSESVTDSNPVRAGDAANAIAAAFIGRIRSIQLARFTTDERSLNRALRKDEIHIATLEKRIAAYKGATAGLQTLKADLLGYQTTYQTLFSSLVQFRATRDASLNDVSIYSPATVGVPTGPHPARTAAIFGFLALLVCGGLILLYDHFSDLARTPEEIEVAAGAPILGTVQAFAHDRSDAPYVEQHPNSPVAEAYRLIRTNLQFASVDRAARTIVVSSTLPAEGKSTTVSNLARVFAEGGVSVTVIDADLRRPSLHHIFGTSDDRRLGLTNVLVAHGLDGYGVQATGLDNLRLVASGPLPPNPADLLASHSMRDALAHLGENADILLLDSPPVLAVADAAILSSMVDGVVLVVDPHTTRRKEINQAREAIDAVGGKILGVVINRLRRRGAMYYHYYGTYGYKYGYKSTYGRSSEGNA